MARKKHNGKRGKMGICPKCHAKRVLTKHHVLPRRHYFGEGEVVLLCRKCHDDMEKIINRRERLTRDEYRKLARKFLTRNGG